MSRSEDQRKKLRVRPFNILFRSESSESITLCTIICVDKVGLLREWTSPAAFCL